MMTRQYLTHSQDPGCNKARLAMPTARVPSQTYQPVIEKYLYLRNKYFLHDAIPPPSREEYRPESA